MQDIEEEAPTITSSRRPPPKLGPRTRAGPIPRDSGVGGEMLKLVSPSARDHVTEPLVASANAGNADSVELGCVTARRVAACDRINKHECDTRA